MIFYASALSSYSAKTRIVLVAKGVPFEEREPPGGYRSDAYRAIVPMGTLPAIVDGAFVLSESEAINEYLEERYPVPSLLPGDPAERARIRFLARFHDLHLEPQVRRLFRQLSPKDRDPTAVAAIASEFQRRLAQLASFAMPAPYLAGATLTLADCGHAVSIPLGAMLLAAIGEPIEEMPPALSAWIAVVHAHPAVARALAPWRPATEAWIAARLGPRQPGP